MEVVRTVLPLSTEGWVSAVIRGWEPEWQPPPSGARRPGLAWGVREGPRQPGRQSALLGAGPEEPEDCFGFVLATKNTSGEKKNVNSQ